MHVVGSRSFDPILLNFFFKKILFSNHSDKRDLVNVFNFVWKILNIGTLKKYFLKVILFLSINALILCT